MKCSSCNKPKAELHYKNSELLKGVKNLMCQSCIDLKYEPRHIIVIASRSYGADSVRDFIVKHRYIGDEITGLEMMV